MTRTGPALLAAALACAAQLPAADRPNVFVILTDDQGWGDLSVHGNTNLRTPHIDSLARDGALFDRFFVQPVCSPTRAEFLTGRWHPRGGVRSTSSGGERLDLDEKTIADAFRAAGYATGCFGKWHNGTQYPYHPTARGFAEYYGFTHGHWGDYFDPPLDHNGKRAKGTGYLPDDLTTHALGFVEANRGRPFFCYLPLNIPHSPMQVPDSYWDRFKAADIQMRHAGAEKEDLDFTRAALAMCENIDANVGRVLAKLAELKLADDTVVVYFSDNGPNSWRWNGGMKGRKGSTDEGGVRSPLLVRYPARVKPGTVVRPIAGAVDLLPTLCGLAGVSPAGDKPLDGKSLVPLLTGAAGDWPDRTIFNYWNGKVSARSQQYRLDATGKLYDMTADPGQTKDVAAAHPEVAARLKQEVAAYRADVLADFGPDRRPFPVGHPEFPTTELPARDGVPHGGVKRSDTAPNDSYFTGWMSADGRATWDVEVATGGRYEAVLYYTCPAADVGATVELTLGAAAVRGKVAEPNDPPLRGKDHDRVTRHAESFVKDFKPLRLGEVTLAAGRGTLTVRATDVPGQQAMDLQAVELRLLK